MGLLSEERTREGRAEGAKSKKEKGQSGGGEPSTAKGGGGKVSEGG